MNKPLTRVKRQHDENKSGPTCIVCGRQRANHFLQSDKFAYWRCRNCGGIFVWPRKEQSFYLDTETYLSNPKNYVTGINPQGQWWMIEQFERLYHQLTGNPNKGKFFEVGAGIGYLTLFATARGWAASGIETSKPAVQFAQDYLRMPISQSTIEDFKSKNKFDAIAMIEVLEHFLDPRKAVNALRGFAHDRTFLFGTTPNTDSNHWQTSEQNIYVPEDHIFLFNEHSIRHFAKLAGLRNFTVELFGSGDKHDSNLMYAGLL